MVREAYAEQLRGGARPVLGSRDPVPVMEIGEREDGFVSAVPAARYLAEPKDWPDSDVAALDECRGRVLDIGAGAGRFALALQARGIDVTALDISPGAVAICRERGVRDTVLSTVADHRGEYDTFLLWCNNLGLLGSASEAPPFLAHLATMARPGARIVAQGTDPYATSDPIHLEYHELNRSRGRLPGQLTVRVRFRHLVSDWYHYLLCSAEELHQLVAGTGWQVTETHVTEPGRYSVILTLKS
jgi:SAM-dependent methyltransferase